MAIGDMKDPTLNTPRHPWRQKRNHVRIARRSQSKWWLDAFYAGGSDIPDVPASPDFGSSVPQLVGSGQVGSLLVLIPARATGNPTPTIVNQWYFDGVLQAGITGLEYTPVVADKGKVVTCRNRATNETGGISSAASNAITVIAATGWWPANVISAIDFENDKAMINGYPYPSIDAAKAAGAIQMNGTVMWSPFTPPAAYSMFFEGTNGNNPGAATGLGLSVGVAAAAAVDINQIGISNTTSFFQVRAANVNVGNITISNWFAAGKRMKRAGRVQVNGVNAGFNGAIGTTDNTVTPAPTLDRIIWGNRWDGAQPWIGVMHLAYITSDSWDNATLAAKTASVADFGTSVPLLVGTGDVGTDLTITRAVATSGATVTYSDQWLFDGVVNSGITGLTYRIQPADTGKVITVKTVATNIAGVAVSGPSLGKTVSNYVVPAFQTNPTLAGSGLIGTRIYLIPGTATGVPDPVLSNQWMFNNVVQSGITGLFYDVAAADEGKVITAKTIATSPREAVPSSTSNGITAYAEIPDYAPSFTTQPSLVGTGVLNTVLTLLVGEADGYPVPDVTLVEWLFNGVVRAGLTSRTYTVLPADDGKVITSRVTMANSVGSVTATTNAVTAMIDPHHIIWSSNSRLAEVALVSPSPATLSWAANVGGGVSAIVLEAHNTPVGSTSNFVPLGSTRMVLANAAVFTVQDFFSETANLARAYMRWLNHVDDGTYRYYHTMLGPAFSPAIKRDALAYGRGTFSSDSKLLRDGYLSGPRMELDEDDPDRFTLLEANVGTETELAAMDVNKTAAIGTWRWTDIKIVGSYIGVRSYDNASAGAIQPYLEVVDETLTAGIFGCGYQGLVGNSIAIREMIYIPPSDVEILVNTTNKAAYVGQDGPHIVLVTADKAAWKS